MPEIILFTCWNESAHPNKQAVVWDVPAKEAGQKVIACPNCGMSHKLTHASKG
jgi:hypothetical protein